MSSIGHPNSCGGTESDKPSFLYGNCEEKWYHVAHLIFVITLVY